MTNFISKALTAEEKKGKDEGRYLGFLSNKIKELLMKLLVTSMDKDNKAVDKDNMGEVKEHATGGGHIIGQGAAGATGTTLPTGTNGGGVGIMSGGQGAWATNSTHCGMQGGQHGAGQHRDGPHGPHRKIKLNVFSTR